MDAQKQLAERLRAAIDEQAAAYGLTTDEVIHLAIEEGLPRIKRRAAKLQEDRAMKAWLEDKLENHTLREIGPMLGYSHENVRYLCAKLGVINPRHHLQPRRS